MTGPASAAPVSAHDAALAMPYHGEDPDRLSLVVDQLSSACTRLAQLNDAVFRARGTLAAAWRGATSERGLVEARRLDQETEGVGHRLNHARTAIDDCCGILRQSRSAVDLLRSQWVHVERQARHAALAVQLATEPLSLPLLVVELDRQRSHGVELRRQWQFEVDRADVATTTCRNLLTGPGRPMAAVGPSGDPGVEGRPTDPGLVGRSTDPALDARHWVSMSAAQQTAVLVSVGRFPPSPAAAPDQVAQAWEGLDPMQRQALIHSEAQLVGSLDGVPVLARDQANRDALARALIAAEHEVATYPPAEPLRGDLIGMGAALAFGFATAAVGPPTAGERRAAAAAQVSSLRQLSEQLRVADGPARYLLSVDPAGRGKAVVAIGNPDTAAAVTTLVPGTGTDLADIPGELSRTEAMRAAAVAAGQPDTAAISWLGYDAPPDLPSAALTGAAAAGAVALNRFQAGLRSTHVGPPSVNTVVAHSYGGLVVADAATGGSELAADQVVFVASTGLGVPSVDQLSLDGVAAADTGDRVFSFVASNDVINASSLVHPYLPTDAGFGGTVVISAPGPEPEVLDVMNTLPLTAWAYLRAEQAAPLSVAAHSGYWDSGSTTLAAFGRIIAAR